MAIVAAARTRREIAGSRGLRCAGSAFGCPSILHPIARPRAVHKALCETATEARREGAHRELHTNAVDRGDQHPVSSRGGSPVGVPGAPNAWGEDEAMSEDLSQYLDTFPGWLRSLGDDAEQLAALLESPGIHDTAREYFAGGVNYLFKSLDLIPDGIDDIGYLDDAFVLRVAAELGSAEDLGDVSPDGMKLVGRLTNEADTVREFLGKDYQRLEAYVKGLRKGAARGRAVSDILGDAATQAEFIEDVRSFARSYDSPSFSREEKNLIKLKSFFDAKLPR